MATAIQQESHFSVYDTIHPSLYPIIKKDCKNIFKEIKNSVEKMPNPAEFNSLINPLNKQINQTFKSPGNKKIEDLVVRLYSKHIYINTLIKIQAAFKEVENNFKEPSLSVQQKILEQKKNRLWSLYRDCVANNLDLAIRLSFEHPACHTHLPYRAWQLTSKLSELDANLGNLDTDVTLRKWVSMLRKEAMLTGYIIAASHLHDWKKKSTIPHVLNRLHHNDTTLDEDPQGGMP